MVDLNRGGRPPRPPAERFWPKVDVRGPDEHWLWTAGTAGGYGYFRVDNTTRVSAIAFAAQTRLGYPCPPGKETQHTHGCPALCCNPAHLAYGRPGYAPGSAGGEGTPLAKLTDQQVAEIRRRYDAGELQTPLAHEFGVGQPNISHIVRGRTWRRPRPTAVVIGE